MSLQPPKIGSSSVSDQAISVAVTKIKKDTFSFRWDIQNFTERLQNKDPKFRLWSPVFYHCDEGNYRHQWQMYVRWTVKEKQKKSKTKDEYISVFLNKNCTKDTVCAAFYIELFKKETPLRNLSSIIATNFTERSSTYGYHKFLKIEKLLDPKEKMLEDDTLKLHCRIEIKSDKVEMLPNSFKPEAKNNAVSRKSHLVSDFTNLFKSSTFTDVSIKTKRSAIKAHKAVLSCRSPVFSAMFQSQMSEAINNIVEILDFDHDVVQGMLQYIYCGELSRGFLIANCSALFQIAEKYDIKGLKEEAEEVLAVNLSVANVSESLILADLNNASNLKKAAIQFINMNKAEVKKTVGFQKLKKHNPSVFIDLF